MNFSYEKLQGDTTQSLFDLEKENKQQKRGQCIDWQRFDRCGAK
jgi:hypothetical protein